MSNNNNSKHQIIKSGLCLIGLLLSFVAQGVGAQNELGFSLQGSSNRCVALRKGQTCYKKITLQWHAPQAGNYCVYDSQSNKPLQCWQQQTAGDLVLKFESQQDIDYELRRENNDSPLAEFLIKVSWVYEPKPDRSTDVRLF